MKLLQTVWNRAKTGLRMYLGPITLHLRFARTADVSVNRPRSPIRRESSSSISDSPFLPMTTTAVSSRGIDGNAAHTPPRSGVAIIVGTGPGLGSALARRFAQAGMTVALAARNAEKFGALLQELPALGGIGRAYGCDATDEQSVKELLALVTVEMGAPDLVVYNVEHFIPGTLLEIETTAFEKCWRAMTLGGFIVGREAARRMMPRGSGTIIFTGTSAALRGRAEFINMAVGKFGIRALAQSMARELGPKGIHVAHVVLDGGILPEHSRERSLKYMGEMFPEHIAEAYYQLHIQHRSVWTQEMDLRPWLEKF